MKYLKHSKEEVLENFYQHRREVILRRTSYELRKAEEKAHILLGLKVAVENVDEVIVDSGAAKGLSQPIIVHSKNAQSKNKNTKRKHRK